MIDKKTTTMKNNNFYFINTEKMNHKFMGDTLFVSGHAIDQMIERKGIYTQIKLERLINESIEFNSEIHFNLEVFTQELSYPEQRYFINEEEGALFATLTNYAKRNEVVATTMALCPTDAAFINKNDGKYARVLFDRKNRTKVDKYFRHHVGMSFDQYVRVNGLRNPFINR